MFSLSLFLILSSNILYMEQQDAWTQSTHNQHQWWSLLSEEKSRFSHPRRLHEFFESLLCQQPTIQFDFSPCSARMVFLLVFPVFLLCSIVLCDFPLFDPHFPPKKRPIQIIIMANFIVGLWYLYMNVWSCNNIF